MNNNRIKGLMNDIHHRVYIRNTILSETESYAYSEFQIRYRFRYMFIFIFCIRSYVVHPLAIKSIWSGDPHA